MTTTPTVLFVCLHGSAKSLIALEHFRRLAQQRGVEVQADWAGIEPDAEIPPRVVQGLLGDGIDVRGRRPRQLTRADLKRASCVVTFDGERPTITRRGMAFADTIFDGRTTLDGVGAIRVDDPDAVPGMHRIRFAAPHARALTACLLIVGLLMPPSCWAYRPFISTDAAVADPQEVEVELGYFTLERDKGENSFIIPRVVLNYGLFRNWEAVGEFAVLRTPDGDVTLIDAAVPVKA